jgi:gamma-glutamylcyclotransferase (GGCT)/AIG2-like uncharacterized protein YtfP
MKIHPAQFPYFFYGTLMEGGTYYDRIKRFQASITTAYVSGELYYNSYKDEEGNPSVTAALKPSGTQRIQGTLFYGSQYDSLELQSILDELEFNFHDKHKSSDKKEKRDRVYLRNLVTCTTENGESHLAWCYLYFSKIEPLRYLVNENFDEVVKFEKTEYDKYLKIIENRL